MFGKRKSTADTEQQYFFIHIPKTGGTSLRKMLYKVFKQQEIFPNAKDIAANEKRYLRIHPFLQADSKHFSQKILFMGHLNIRALSVFDKRPFVFTLLRDPYEQVCSMLNHLLTLDVRFKKTPPEEILNTVINHNPQTRLFCPFKKRLNQQDLKRAKINLEKLDFVGITKQFEDSVKALWYINGWKKVSFKYENQSKRSYRFDHLNDIILPKIELDIELYAFAVKLFERKFKNIVEN